MFVGLRQDIVMALKNGCQQYVASLYNTDSVISV